MKVCGKTVYSRNPAFVVRDAEMVLLFRDGKTLQEIGNKYGVTREYVRQRLSSLGLTRMDGGAAFRELASIRDKAEKTAQAVAKREQGHFDKWGMSRADVEKLSPLPRSSPRHPIQRFIMQRKNSRKRGIEWRMTFAEWWRVWQDSGKWELRGKGEGYCMARWADDGPYSVENVYICTIGQNFSDSYITKPMSARIAKRKARISTPLAAVQASSS